MRMEVSFSKAFLSQEVLDEVNEQLDPELEQLHTGSTHDDELAKMFHGRLTKRLTNVVTFCPSLQDALFAHPKMLEYVSAMFASVSSPLLAQHTGDRNPSGRESTGSASGI